MSEGILILSCLPKAHSPFTHFKTHTITLISWTWTLLESWKDNVQDPGHLTLLVPDVTPIMDGGDGMPSYCPHPLSGTGPSCVVVGTGYITTRYTFTVHLYTVQSVDKTMSPMPDHGSLGQILYGYEVYEKIKSNHNTLACSICSKCSMRICAWT